MYLNVFVGKMEFLPLKEYSVSVILVVFTSLEESSLTIDQRIGDWAKNHKRNDNNGMKLKKPLVSTSI